MDKSLKTRRSQARAAYANLTGLVDLVKTNQSAEDPSSFDEAQLASVREQLHALVDHLVDDLEAYKTAFVGGAAVVGQNALGHSRMHPVRMMEVMLCSSCFELQIKARSPLAEDSDLVVPPTKTLFTA